MNIYRQSIVHRAGNRNVQWLGKFKHEQVYLSTPKHDNALKQIYKWISICFIVIIINRIYLEPFPNFKQWFLWSFGLKTWFHLITKYRARIFPFEVNVSNKCCLQHGKEIVTSNDIWSVSYNTIIASWYIFLSVDYASKIARFRLNVKKIILQLYLWHCTIDWCYWRPKLSLQVFNVNDLEKLNWQRIQKSTYSLWWLISSLVVVF